MFNKIERLRFYCQKVLPLVYDDSLSYYELLSKVAFKINELVGGLDKTNDNFENLEKYVNEYFSKLDISDAVKEVVDDKIESGELTASFVLSWLYGKKVVVYGDSTTQISTSYIRKLEAAGVDITNRGISGTAWIHSNNSNGAIDLIPAAADLSNFDYVFLCYGTNDAGGWDTNFAYQESTLTSANYLKYCINTVFNAIRSAGSIPVCIIPTLVYMESWGSGQTNQYTGSTQDHTNDMIIQECIANHVKYFNLWNSMPVNKYNVREFMENDGGGTLFIHPNDRLNNLIYKSIVNDECNNGLCYNETWTECTDSAGFAYEESNVARPTQYPLVPDSVKADARFLPSYGRTSSFDVCAEGSALLRISFLAAPVGTSFGKIQMALVKFVDGSEVVENISLFSRACGMTRATVEVTTGTYALRFYTTDGNGLWLMDFKMEVAGGICSGHVYSAPVTSSLQLSRYFDFKLSVSGRKYSIKSTTSQFQANQAIPSGTTIATFSSPVLVYDINRYMYFMDAADGSIVPALITANTIKLSRGMQEGHIYIPMSVVCGF